MEWNIVSQLKLKTNIYIVLSSESIKLDTKLLQTCKIHFYMGITR